MYFFQHDFDFPPNLYFFKDYANIMDIIHESKNHYRIGMNRKEILLLELNDAWL